MEMAATVKKPEDSDIAKRLSRLRQVVSGENQTAFAARMGIEVKRWNNFERGLPLSKEIAFLLIKKVPGLTLDWLWLGIESGLPIQLQRELTEAGKATTSAKGAKSPR
jgi:hypothetical protein